MSFPLSLITKIFLKHTKKNDLKAIIVTNENHWYDEMLMVVNGIICAHARARTHTHTSHHITSHHITSHHITSHHSTSHTTNAIKFNFPGHHKIDNDQINFNQFHPVFFPVGLEIVTVETFQTLWCCDQKILTVDRTRRYLDNRFHTQISHD
jgi:hypothetical protein